MLKVKDKERILRASREKQLITYKDPTPITLVADFSIEVSDTIYSKWWKKEKFQLRILYPVKLPFRIENEISLSDKQKLKGIHHH